MFQGVGFGILCRLPIALNPKVLRLRKKGLCHIVLGIDHLTILVPFWVPPKTAVALNTTLHPNLTVLVHPRPHLLLICLNSFCLVSPMPKDQSSFFLCDCSALPIGSIALPLLGLSERIPNIKPQKGTTMEPTLNPITLNPETPTP